MSILEDIHNDSPPHFTDEKTGHREGIPVGQEPAPHLAAGQLLLNPAFLDLTNTNRFLQTDKHGTCIQSSGVSQNPHSSPDLQSTSIR